MDELRHVLQDNSCLLSAAFGHIWKQHQPLRFPTFPSVETGVRTKVSVISYQESNQPPGGKRGVGHFVAGWCGFSSQSHLAFLLFLRWSS